jgi:hypothetical protein
MTDVYSTSAPWGAHSAAGRPRQHTLSIARARTASRTTWRTPSASIDLTHRASWRDHGDRNLLAIRVLSVGAARQTPSHARREASGRSARHPPRRAPGASTLVAPTVGTAVFPARTLEPPLTSGVGYAGSRSLPLRASRGSVQAERSKQHGLRLPLFIFDRLTSTRRLRVSGLLVAFTQRTHSHRAIGVIPFHTSWIF